MKGDFTVKINNIASMLMVVALTGCASGYKITYNTEPSGASVICSGTNHGYSPVTLNYTSDESSKRTGSMKTVPCTAIWSSGMRKNFGVTWDLNKFPDGVMQTLQRPSGEGYAQDADFALRVQQMKQQQAQGNAAATQRALENLNRSIEQNRPKTTYTNCYGTYGGVNCNSTTY